MEEFQKYGFNPLSNDQIEELIQANLNVIPHFQRYEGMGWVKLLVEYKLNQIAPGVNPKRYILTHVGGENGYTAEDNFEKYCQLNSESQGLTLDEILSEIKPQSWIEVIDKEESDNITIQHCVERKHTSS